MLEILDSLPIINLLISETAVSIYKGQVAVRFIYDILFLILFLMTWLSIEIIFNKNQRHFFTQHYILMEFLINFPITLGVIGTLYAISIEVAENNTKAIHDVITSNFGAAVVTTIIGALVYGYCFLLQALVSRYINNDSEETIPSSNDSH